MSEQVTESDKSTILIEVWADLGCPWCYLAKHRLREAVAERGDRDRFEIRIRSFQLEPNAPQEPEKVERAYLRGHGGTAADFQQAERQMRVIARNEGLDFSLDRRHANSFALHRVLQYATDQGRGLEFFSAVQDGYFAGTLDPYAPGALAEAGETVGLAGARIREIVAGSEYADRVLADRAEALELGATGVPFAVFDRRLAAPGAQKVAVYRRLLEQVAGAAPAAPEEKAM